MLVRPTIFNCSLRWGLRPLNPPITELKLVEREAFHPRVRKAADETLCVFRHFAPQFTTRGLRAPNPPLHLAQVRLFVGKSMFRVPGTTAINRQDKPQGRIDAREARASQISLLFVSTPVRGRVI